MHQRKNIKQALNQSDDFGEDQKEFESFMDEGKPLNLTVGPSSSASDEKDDKKKKEKRNLTSEKKNEPEIMEEIDITGEEIKQRRKPSTRKPKQNPSGSCCSEGSICGLPNYDENDKGIKWLPLFFLAIFVFPLFITIGDWLMQQDFMKSFVPAPTHHYCLENYFKQVNPSRVAKVGQILEDYKGKEDVLFHKLERKYRVQVPCKL